MNYADKFLCNIAEVMESPSPEDKRAFWRRQLAGSEAPQFPITANASKAQGINKTFIHAQFRLLWPRDEFAATASIGAAWAIVTAHYTGSQEALFASGSRHTHDGHDTAFNPHCKTLPVRIVLDWDATPSGLLAQVGAQARDMRAMDLEISEIRALGEDAEQCCGAQTLITVEQSPSLQNDAKSNGRAAMPVHVPSDVHKENLGADMGPHEELHAYTLWIHCNWDGENVSLRMLYASASLGEDQVQRYAQQLQHVLEQLHAVQPFTCIRDIEVVTPSDLHDIAAWNSAAPKISDNCVHELIENTINARPDNLAVCSWNERLTYRELDSLSSSIASNLVARGTGPEVVVPLCFDKSSWFVVSLLAVMKAGGTAVVLEPSLPAERLRVLLCRFPSIRVVIASQQTHALVSSITDIPVILASKAAQDRCARPLESKAVPGNTAVVQFTSGSVGIPKACFWRYGQMATLATLVRRAFHLDEHTRTYQFASYGFAVGIIEIVSVLVSGGTICIPSSGDIYNYLDTSLAKLEANTIFITPSAAKAIDPSKNHGLRTVILVGEPPTGHDVARWSNTTKVYDCYGCAEYPLITASRLSPDLRVGVTQGVVVGAERYVVDQINPTQPAPIGAIGQLSVSGPLLAAHDSKADSQTCDCEAPTFNGNSSRSDCKLPMYKTGDLVMFGTNGSLQHMGRIGTQVKIRGQRVDLREAESYLELLISGRRTAEIHIEDLAVEAVIPFGSSNEVLVAFLRVCANGQTKASHVTTRTRQLFQMLALDAAKHLPRYAIPSACYIVDAIPKTKSGKIDRTSLRNLGRGIILDELYGARDSTHSKRDPMTDAERLLVLCSCEVLGLEETIVTPQDHFFHIGGDSIQAMKLVAKARDAGLSLTVALVFRWPRLCDLAEHATTDLTHVASARAAPRQATAGGSTITLPLTDFQNFCVGMSLSRHCALVYEYDLTFRGRVDVRRLQVAVLSVLQRRDSLRLRFQRTSSGQLYQRLIPSNEVSVEIQQANDVASHLPHPHDLPVHFSIRHLSQTDDTLVGLYVRLHHAVFDGYCLASLWEDLCAAYRYDRRKLKERPSFAQYAVNRLLLREDTSFKYWRHLLFQSSPTMLRASLDRLQDDDSPVVSLKARRTVDIPRIRIHTDTVTMATLVKAAWAIMLAKMCGTQDVIFLHLVHGRAEEYTGSADIIGCCATEIPVRVRFGLQGVVSSFQLLSLIQRQLLQSSPHAHLGSHHIAADCTNWPKKDQFYRHSTFVQHQNIDEPTSFPFGEDAQCDITYRTPESGIYDFTLVSRPSDGGMSFELKAAGDLYTQAEVDQVADAVRSLIIDLNCETDKPLDELYCDDLSLPGANQN